MGNKSFTIRCDITDNFTQQTQMITKDVSCITTSGSLSSNEIWPSDVTLQGTVTVPSGLSLTISGSTVQFPSGVSLIVNGSLYAEYSTFTSTGSTTPGSWGNIQFNGDGANGSTLNQVGISYGTEIDLNNTDGVLIQGCNITNNSDNGIYLYFSSDCNISYNTIANSNIYHGIRMDGGSLNNCYQNIIYKTNQNHQGAGILYSGCYGFIWQNDIRGYNWGIGAIWGASPLFYNPDNDGRNNRITNCLDGVMAYQQSWPVICPDVAGDFFPYLGNSIYNNNPYNVYFTSGDPPLTAEVTWWGGDPAPSMFYAPGSSVEYWDCLTYDPWSDFPLPSVSSSGWAQGGRQIEQRSGKAHELNGAKTAKSTTSASIISSQRRVAFPVVEQQPPGQSRYDGIRLRLQNKYKEAKDFFLSYLGKHPNDQAAYVELYNCYNKETAADIINYFESLPSVAAKEHKLLLSNLYLMQKDIAKAKKVNDGLISKSKNTALAEKAKLNNFYIALYNDNDPESAATILSDALSAPALSTDMELSDAQHALETYIDPKTGTKPNFKLLAKAAEPLPTTYGMDQNYPNPFNPSTTINYQLPENSHVVIKIYDLLGRDVRTLVNEDKPAGRYSVDFNASNFSSGTYFYTIRAGNYNAVKKLMLLK